MARVTTVEKARKDQGNCSGCGDPIKVGDSYRWWKFLRGPRYVRCSKPDCRPKPSDLTRSEFYSGLYDLQDRLQSALDTFRLDGDGGSLAGELNDVASELRTLGEECREKYDNMPEGLRQGDTGQLLETRADECESRADELESAASDAEGYEDPEVEDEQDGARDDAASDADIDLSID